MIINFQAAVLVKDTCDIVKCLAAGRGQTQFLRKLAIILLHRRSIKETWRDKIDINQLSYLVIQIAGGRSQDMVPQLQIRVDNNVEYFIVTLIAAVGADIIFRGIDKERAAKNGIISPHCTKDFAWLSLCLEMGIFAFDIERKRTAIIVIDYAANEGFLDVGFFAVQFRVIKIPVH